MLNIIGSYSSYSELETYFTKGCTCHSVFICPIIATTISEECEEIYPDKCTMQLNS